METEAEVGWTICGINGCILADRHAGDCIFPEIEGARRRCGTARLSSDYLDAPQLLSSKPPKASASSQPASASRKIYGLRMYTYGRRHELTHKSGSVESMFRV